MPFVACWRTELADEPGRIFGEAFATAIAGGDEPAVAFSKACTAVETVTVAARLDQGTVGGQAPLPRVLLAALCCRRSTDPHRVELVCELD